MNSNLKMTVEWSKRHSYFLLLVFITKCFSKNLSQRLDILTENVTRIDKAIDDMLFYSFQYNLRIVGVLHVGEIESSEETVELCVKLFSALGVETPISDIDIAHRVP